MEAFKWGDVRTAGVEEPGVLALVFRRVAPREEPKCAASIPSAPGLYALGARTAFERVYGPPGRGAVVLGLPPGYLERADSSLVHMVEDLRGRLETPGESAGDGFYPR